MTKIAYNGCFGGFSLSYDAVKAYAKRKGFEVYCGRNPDIKKGLDNKYVECTREEANGGYGFYSWFKTPDFDWDNAFYDRDIPRNDPDLIAVIEELGSRQASGRCAQLEIADVEAGKKYRIDEYDGNEQVMTQDDYEWATA